MWSALAMRPMKHIGNVGKHRWHGGNVMPDNRETHPPRRQTQRPAKGREKHRLFPTQQTHKAPEHEKKRNQGASIVIAKEIPSPDQPAFVYRAMQVHVQKKINTTPAKLPVEAKSWGKINRCIAL